MSPTFRALRNPNYRLYLVGSVVSNTGTWLQRTAQDWLVLKPLHGGGTDLGIVTALQFLPVLLLTPYAGVVADRVPKRRLLQITQLAMAVAALLLAALALSGAAEIWMVYVLAFVFGIGAAFDVPARQSFVSEMVGPDDLTNAVGLNSAAFNTARIIGPALAGLLIAAFGGGAAATGIVIALNALSYLAVIVQLQRMDVSLLRIAPMRARGPGALREGVRYVRTQPTMLFVLVLVFFAGTFGMNFQLTSSLMATEVFGKGAGEFGILGSALAVGSLAGALLAARRVTIPLRLLVLAATGFGVAEIIAGSLPSYLVFALFSPVIGFCTITLLNSSNATIQLTSDPAMRGRAMALYMTVVQGGTPIGAPVIGWIGETAGARWTLWLGGVMVLVGVALAITLLARLRGGLASVLTPYYPPGSLGNRVWKDQARVTTRPTSGV
ncbi:MFS transporter [Nocardioides nematodiphilus]|uniref:MFS transporter n=1 Tax=Nocardioides nematodiphilus TaxID=2849669 RepID=UPI001CD9BA71|nr:MFS transporter [Nocardioides nematodiphilus]MCA1981373.1 MFS transporter [Nocardioides nematodiphilus]